MIMSQLLGLAILGGSQAEYNARLVKQQLDPHLCQLVRQTMRRQ